jgi:hypothetical protein
MKKVVMSAAQKACLDAIPAGQRRPGRRGPKYIVWANEHLLAKGLPLLTAAENLVRGDDRAVCFCARGDSAR